MRAMLTGPGQARFEAQGLCLIKPGRNKEARHSDDTRKGNTNAQTLPEHYRWHVCCLARVSLVPAYGRSKEAGNLEQACAQGWAVLSLYCKTNGTCYMRQLISMVLLVTLRRTDTFLFHSIIQLQLPDTLLCFVSRRTPTEAGSECDY